MWRGAALLMAGPLLVACALDPRAQISASRTGAAAGTSLEPPQAFYSWQAGGAPGAWTPNQVVGTHLQVSCAYDYGKCFHPGLIITGATATRSPATAGAQSVLLRTIVYKPDPVFGGWMFDLQDDQAIAIPAGTQAAPSVDRSWVLNTAGAKHVVFIAVWGDEHDQALGWRRIVMDQSSDYVCQTVFTWACDVYDGFVSVASPS